MIALLIWVVILGLLYWAVLQLPLPAPFPTVVKIIFILLLIIVLLNAVGYVSFPLPQWRR